MIIYEICEAEICCVRKCYLCTSSMYIEYVVSLLYPYLQLWIKRWFFPKILKQSNKLKRIYPLFFYILISGSLFYKINHLNAFLHI